MKYTVENLKDLTMDDLKFLWNEYCYENNYEYVIHQNDKDFWENFADIHGISSLVSAIHFGTFDYHDKYIVNNGYNNFKTFTYAEELYDIIDVDDLVEFLNKKNDEEEK
jgi:hypothetical protein